MIKKEASFRRKTFLAMILVGTIPVLILTIVSASIISYPVRKEQLMRDRALIVQVGRQIEQVIASAILDLEILATNPILIGNAVSAEERKRELARITRPDFPELSLLDRSGFIIESTGNISVVQDYSPWFTTALMKQKTVVSNPYQEQDTEKLFISFYIPVARAKKSTTAVIKATISFDRFSEILASVDPIRSDFLALVDGRGNLLGATDELVPVQQLKKIGMQNRQAFEPTGSCRLEDGRIFFFSAQEVRPLNQLEFTRTWMLAYFRDPGGVMAIVYQSFRYQVLATAIGLLVSVVLGWIFAKRLTDPASRFRQASSNGKDGAIKLAVVTTEGNGEQSTSRRRRMGGDRHR